MAFEFTKSSNAKCPPIVLGGLVVICLFLLCNWWSLSSQNFELLKQIDNLGEQLRVNGEELGKCSRQQLLLDEKLKDSQTKFVQQQIKLEQIRETENNVKETYESVQRELSKAKKNYESVKQKLEICSSDKVSLQKIQLTQDKALETLKTEKKQLQNKITDINKQVKYLEEKSHFSKALINFNKIISVPPIVQKMHSKIKSSEIKVDRNKSQENDQKQEGEDGKNYGDSSWFPMEVEDPREKAMKV